MLEGLGDWLDKASKYAKEKSFEPDTLLQCRLAPDQFSLLKQIQAACDTAKFIPARLAGVEMPSHPDDEKTYPEIQARVRHVVELLAGVAAERLVGCEDRRVELPFLPDGTWVRGTDFLVEMALPNFYFHLTTTYAILRHNGVPLGKRDFIRELSLQT